MTVRREIREWSSCVQGDQERNDSIWRYFLIPTTMDDGTGAKMFLTSNLVILLSIYKRKIVKIGFEIVKPGSLGLAVPSLRSSISETNSFDHHHL